MRWQGRRTSRNIEDRRGRRMTGSPAKLGGIGLLAVVLIGAFLGVDVTPFLGGGGMSPAPAPSGPNQIDDSAEEFVAVVLADTEAVWGEIFRNSNLQYVEPKLVLFNGRTSSACGLADAATGPFYCPNDQQVYLDTDFFRVMDTELGARGDFAKAYVVAHEVGHHVQNLLGTLEHSNRLRAQSSQAESNAISVRVELQADCYSGLWARAVQERFGVLEPGDIEEALNTAARIGDDALQRASRGVVVPDSFTHGTSDQRQRWFAAGYQSGDPQACDTFSARDL
ncbi:neutral zinc metallopeptidase [Fluviibacterium sp. DFM31]|uniref:Neutral zinc metallopeptidase n=1 Tax=Meridianimarinicoccus marinus TaxID=3231483 RepID=A0ABV3L513_9RHOB